MVCAIPGHYVCLWFGVSVMAADHAAWLFAIAVGFVSAGLIGSLWGIATHEEPRLGALLDPNPSLLTPLRALVIVFAAPTTILLDAFDDLIDRPILGVPIFVVSLVWSFFQGVFILTQVFGLT
jgi:hypothetical protein